MQSNQKPMQELVEKLVTDERTGTFVQVLVHLSQYLYAMSRLREVVDTPRGSWTVPHVFYIESLYTMLANWFSVKGRRGRYILKHALIKLELEAELQHLDQVLDSPIGDTTFRKLVEDFRNTQTTHQ